MTTERRPDCDPDFEITRPAPIEIRLWGVVLARAGEVVSRAELYRRMHQLEEENPGAHFSTPELLWVRDALRGRRPRMRPALEAAPVVDKTPLPEHGISGEAIGNVLCRIYPLENHPQGAGLTPEECQVYLEELSRIIDNERDYVSSHRGDGGTDTYDDIEDALWSHQAARDRFLKILGSEKVSAYFRNRKRPVELPRMKEDDEAPAASERSGNAALSQLATEILAVVKTGSNSDFIRDNPDSELAKHSAGLTSVLEYQLVGD